MKTLAILKEQDINPNAPAVDTSDFTHRRAARAVVLNEKGEVALLNVGRANYHKLPGGGIEDDEDMLKALERELLEEIGCQAEIIEEIGQIQEYRDQWRELQTSYCYLAKQTGEQKQPVFTAEELADGFEIVWAENLDKAIAMLEADEPENYVGEFIKLRDSQFLKAAKPLAETR